MAVYHSISEYRNSIKAKLKAITQAGKDGTLTASKFMMKTAKARAPRKSGKLIAGIRRRPTKKGFVVSSTVSGFPYHYWIDQSVTGYRAFSYNGPFGAWIPRGKFGGPKMIAPQGTIAVYGKKPATWKWTGEAGYFRKSIIDTKKIFKKVVQDNINKALRVRV